VTTAFDEFVFLCFFILVCWKLRPTEDNPYMRAGFPRSGQMKDLDDGEVLMGSIFSFRHDDESNVEDEKEDEDDDGNERKSLTKPPQVNASADPPKPTTFGSFLSASAANSFSALAR